jgi:hypothetical protein
MDAMPMGGRNDDPRKLREMLEKAADLAYEHALHSTVVGLAADEGDLLFPELVDYVESALRMDDSIFRMTRERAVLLLADVGLVGAREIVERLLSGFRDRFARVQEPDVRFSFFEVQPDGGEVSVKRVLPALFAPQLH